MEEEEEEVEKLAAPEPLVKPLTEPKYKVVLIRDKEQSNGGRNQIFAIKTKALILSNYFKATAKIRRRIFLITSFISRDESDG